MRLTPTNNNMEELLNTKELAIRLKVQPYTVRVWASEGLIPAIRIRPNVIRFDWDAVMVSLKLKEDSNRGPR